MMYTEEQKQIRDKSLWTVVQAVLAPLQFVIFLISLGLVLYYLATGEAYTAATSSIVAKTLILYTIMITGAIWEKEIFGQYLFAPAFFWEDVVSMLVLALHTAYLFGLWAGWPQDALITTALLAYASYVINAGQFLLKLREARRQPSPVPMAAEAHP
jgi:3-vinyl bacteriochlorophyllide hydratase